MINSNDVFDLYFKWDGYVNYAIYENLKNVTGKANRSYFFKKSTETAKFALQQAIFIVYGTDSQIITPLIKFEYTLEALSGVGNLLDLFKKAEQPELTEELDLFQRTCRLMVSQVSSELTKKFSENAPQIASRMLLIFSESYKAIMLSMSVIFAPPKLPPPITLLTDSLCASSSFYCTASPPQQPQEADDDEVRAIQQDMNELLTELQPMVPTTPAPETEEEYSTIPTVSEWLQERLPWFQLEEKDELMFHQLMTNPVNVYNNAEMYACIEFVKRMKKQREVGFHLLFSKQTLDNYSPTYQQALVTLYWLQMVLYMYHHSSFQFMIEEEETFKVCCLPKVGSDQDLFQSMTPKEVRMLLHFYHLVKIGMQILPVNSNEQLWMNIDRCLFTKEHPVFSVEDAKRRMFILDLFRR